MLPAFAVSLAVSLILCGLLLPLAPRLGLVDHPDSSRKSHRMATPRAGGFGIAGGFAAGLCLLQPNAELAPALVLLLVGGLDDRWPMSWKPRLLVQLGCGVAGAWLLGIRDPLPLCAAVFWIVGLVNAVNMLDSMDLLAGGAALLVAGGLALMRPEDGVPVALMGALLGFLPYNWPTAKLFMGDSGSTFLGYLLAVGSLRLVCDSPPLSPWGWFAPLVLMALPWYDLATVVALRLWQRRSPFEGDRQHLPHRLESAGLRQGVAVALLHLLAAAGAGAALLLHRTGESLYLLLAVVSWLLLAAVDIAIIRRKFLGAS